MKSLELAIPPPFIMLATALAMWLLSVLLPRFAFAALHNTWAAIVFAAAGILFGVAGILAFKRAHTTPDPRTPGAATALVTSGVYRVTRNPMYLGSLLLLIGWGFYLGNVWSLIFAFAFPVYIQRYQIRPEERALMEKFGADYAAYKTKVRAWL
ncbi:DUF1295 domain-containing protein [Pusillimonas sp. TS35]|uniref:methyltransferase family protein n=1 Tax=Paracandidimonas lactea TaxID=2895524 RepID=UPI001369B394|nr:isoprenylcysteine carboxylmethyltransferase family protein [Paracandidimonas lactea]MYN14239.1 DUF1295 domain-containing protein [Pusillimonas sp. TS35]